MFLGASVHSAARALLLGFLRCFLTLLSAGGAQTIVHRMVAFMAGVLKNLIARLMADGKCYRPGRGEGLRIGDSHLVFDGVGSDTRETLHQLQIFAVRNSSHIYFAPDEIRGLHHQSVALKMAARIAH